MSKKKGSKLAEYLGSYRGKTLFNFFYGFGAAVAILGTLFKILHLDGANVMLALGLGTEVLMFAISAFEPPFRNYHWEEVFPVLKSGKPEDRPNFNGGVGGGSVIVGNIGGEVNGNMGSGVVGNVGGEAPAYRGEQAPIMGQPSETFVAPAPMGQTTVVVGSQAPSMEQASFHLSSPAGISAEDSKLLETGVKEYIEQMGNLNLNLRGLNTIYEIQLKSISSQIDTIDRINKGLVNIKDMYENSASDNESFVTETEQMASNLANLNQIYSRMLQAMVAGNGFMGHNFGETNQENDKTAGSKKSAKEASSDEA